MSLLRELVYDGMAKLSDFLKAYITDETIIVIPSGVFAYRIPLKEVDHSDVDSVVSAILSNVLKRAGKIIFGGYTVQYNLLVRRVGGRVFFSAKYKFPPERVNYPFVTLNQLGKPQSFRLMGTDRYIIEILVDFVREESLFIFDFGMKTIPNIPLEGIVPNENIISRLRACFSYYKEQGLLKMIMDNPDIIADVLLSPFTAANLI